MIDLRRQFYLTIIRLHPASFRNQFGAEMARDYEDALDTYGFRTLGRDALLSLARQWTAHILTTAPEPISAPRPSLLAGDYIMLQNKALTPLELFRGLAATVALLALCATTLNARPRHPPSLSLVFAVSSTSPPTGSNTNSTSTPGDGGPTSQTRLLQSTDPVFAQATPPAAHPPSGFSATLALGADGRPLAFDVVSIREDKSVSPSAPSQHPTPDGYHVKDMPLFALIQDAYVPSAGTLSFRPGDVIGAPGWLLSALYDIDARVSDADLPRWTDPAQQPAMRHAMLQAMLADRFKLAAHRETRIMPVFELTVSKSGPKFKPAELATLDEIRRKHPDASRMADGTIAASGPNPGQQTFFGVTMPAFCALLRNLAGRPVRDKTGLTGKYDISFQLELLPRQQESGVPVPPDPYSLQIHTVVEDQLGLRLTSTRGPVEVLVIDSISRPTPN